MQPITDAEHSVIEKLIAECDDTCRDIGRILGMGAPVLEELRSARSYLRGIRDAGFWGVMGEDDPTTGQVTEPPDTQVRAAYENREAGTQVRAACRALGIYHAENNIGDHNKRAALYSLFWAGYNVGRYWRLREDGK